MFNNKSPNPNQQQISPEGPQRTVFERRSVVERAVYNEHFSITNVDPALLAGAIYPAETISQVESSNFEKPAAAAGMAVVDAEVSLDHSQEGERTILEENDPFGEIENTMLLDNLYEDSMQTRNQELADVA